jgi:hypothetical protein
MPINLSTEELRLAACLAQAGRGGEAAMDRYRREYEPLLLVIARRAVRSAVPAQRPPPQAAARRAARWRRWLVGGYARDTVPAVGRTRSSHRAAGAGGGC